MTAFSGKKPGSDPHGRWAGTVGVRPGEDIGLGPLALVHMVLCPSWALMPSREHLPASHPFSAALRLAPNKTLADIGQLPLRWDSGAALIPAHWSLVPQSLLPASCFIPMGVSDFDLIGRNHCL